MRCLFAAVLILHVGVCMGYPMERFALEVIAEPGDSFKKVFDHLGYGSLYHTAFEDPSVQDVLELYEDDLRELLKDEMHVPVIQRMRVARALDRLREDLDYRGHVIPQYDEKGVCLHCDLLTTRPRRFYMPLDESRDYEHNVHRILKDHHWQEVFDYDHADFCWLWGNGPSQMNEFYASDKRGGSPWRMRIINQIPNEDVMINKGGLLKSMQAYDTTLGTSAALRIGDVHPETYLLNNKDQCRTFFEKLPAVAGPNEAWVVKEGHASMGNGITMYANFSEIRARFLDADGECTDVSDSGAQIVIQKYIPNPLLLRERKSEVRLYWVVASLDPLMVYVYFTGTVRLTASVFTMNDFHNPLIHITNIDQQKKYYDEFGVAGETLGIDELKWNFTRLEDDLVERGLAQTGYMNNTLIPRLKKMLVYALNSTYNEVPHDPAYFAVYGADFILDDTLRPFLTELQFAPDFNHDKSPKKEVLPPMIMEAINIALEVRERRRAGLDLAAPLLSLRGFSPIIDLSQDKPFYFA